MRVEEKRIFISDLPETATKTDIESTFKNYGNVISVEIKERKEMGPKNNSLFFAYVNIKIDDKNLQQCFNDFSNEKWHGHYVILQIARESFLERLKRERESQSKTQNKNGLEKPSETPQPQDIRNIPNGIKKEVIKHYKSSTESDSSDTDSVHMNKEDPVQNQYIVTKKKNVKRSSSTLENAEDKISADINETVDIIIKNNKGKVIDKNGLKIESVGNKPIIKIDIAKKKDSVNSSEANLKRLQSLKNLKKGYQTQKLLIQSALSKIDSNSKSKVIFDDSIVDTYSKSNEGKPSRMSLFDEDPNEEEFEANFNLREQFQGKEGQKLLELQSKYKNDKRFTLDARFLDKNETNHVENINNEEENEEMSLEEEKKKEYEILEQVLGKKVNPRSVRQEEFQRQKKVMLRFDPTQPEHSKFEIKKDLGKQKKRKRNDSEVETPSEKTQVEQEVPEVSEEKFYKITDNLKESLQEKQEFSLLSMFGQTDEREEQTTDESSKQFDTKTNIIPMGKNPFRYDSSDDEDETEIVLNQSQQEAQKSSERVQSNINRNTLWCEPFFFKNDDYRLQEGFDFIEKMRSEEKTEFTKLRRDLKEIVKAKVRNNQRKHKPFRKKLGGNKRKKMIKMKKALKR